MCYTAVLQPKLIQPELDVVVGREGAGGGGGRGCGAADPEPAVAGSHAGLENVKSLI